MAVEPRSSEAPDHLEKQPQAEQARRLSMLGRWARGEIGINDLTQSTDITGAEDPPK